MHDFSLYTRMLAQGTLSEAPQDIPDAAFALPSTIHWMRALSILVQDQKIDFQAAREFYSLVQRRTLSDKELNSVCEQLLFALSQLASLQAMRQVPNKADVARIGIMAWYYGIYGAASAMVVATDGSFPNNHSATAQQWDRQLSAPGLVMTPFESRLSNLLKDDIDTAVRQLRQLGTHQLTTRPETVAQAWGSVAEYLSGSSRWARDAIQDDLRKSREFKELGVNDFRTKRARELRDQRLAKRSIGFLHQAIRYRGKANYRDAIYLAYGNGLRTRLEGFIDDLSDVLASFCAMAGGYVSHRVGRDIWTNFVNDLEEKRAVSVSPKSLWT